MHSHQRLVLTISVLASFVAFLDGSVINVALPAIVDELGGGLSVQQWVVDAYLITLGSLILLAGSLSDVLGRILIIRIGLIGFGVTSLFCALAPTAELLIVSRGLQGIAGALLVPSSLALIMTSFRGAAQSMAIGQWTAWTSSAFLAGPLLGGLFVDYLSWRWVFAINVVPIAVTLWLLFTLGQKDSRVAGVKIDFLGAALCVVGLGGPVFALIEQSNFGWGSPVVLGPLVVGIVSFCAFLWHQKVTREPLMPLGLFTVRNFWVGNVATTLIYGALSIGGFVVVLFLQEVAHFPATLAALALLPMTILNILLASRFGTLSGKYGPRLFMALGPIVAAVGYLLMLTAQEDVNYWTQVFPGVILFGVGLSATVAPLTSAILGSISEAQSGIGSAVNNAVSRVAGLIAIALAGVIIGERMSLGGFERGLIVTAALLIAGGVVSAVGIVNPKKAAVAETDR
ncbi:MAG: family efflux transporter permease subunit [Glaciihabitans sp.]|nr:family efflux transporter permease subunit [Glaciihabitans sp.]